MHRLACFLLLAGCHSVGPQAVPRDRFDYSAAVGESWKREMLLNVVKIRYLDTPIFLKVQQILAGYTVTGTGQVGWAEPGNFGAGWNVGGSAQYTDRPTITYRPMTGEELGRNLMTPIEPHHVLAMIQAGYSAELVMPLCVQSINGLRNRQGAHGLKADPRFEELVEAMATAHGEAALGMRIIKGKEKGKATTIFAFRREGASEEGLAAVETIGKLLRLKEESREFKVLYGTAPGGGDQIVMLTRSPLRIMIELATMVSVPEKDKAYAVPVTPAEKPLIRIRSGKDAPGNAYIEVSYRGSEFWIEDKDLQSKRTFAFMNLLFNFVETGPDPTPTLVTVPG